MSTSDDLITKIIAREGGFVNHPMDRGGATCWGITIATLRDWRRKPVGIADVQSLSQDEAREIYRVKYFQASGFDQIPDAMTVEFLFDFAVNSGVVAATRALQRAVGTPDDGVIGPKSIAAIKAVTNWGMLFYRTKCERYELLLRYVGSDAEQAAFAIGWSNRLDQFEEKVT